MRLSTAKDRDDTRSLAVLAAALEAGIELLDTADAYAHEERDIGHNERLIARVLAGRAARYPRARPSSARRPRGIERLARDEVVGRIAAAHPATREEVVLALLVELDDIVWRGRPAKPADVALVTGVRDALARWVDAGYAFAGTPWLTPAAVDARLAELLGLPIAIARCAHPAGPPVCWCRKPLPGLALWLAREHGFDLTRSVHVGKGAADRGFAQRAGLAYVGVGAGFPAPANSAS